MSGSLEDLRHELGEVGVPWDTACDLSRGGRSAGRTVTYGRVSARADGLMAGRSGAVQSSTVPGRSTRVAMTVSRSHAPWVWRERRIVGWSAGLGVLIGVISLLVTYQMLDGVGDNSNFFERVLLWPFPYVQGATAVTVGLGILLIGVSCDWCKDTADGVHRTVWLLLGVLTVAVAPMVLVAAFFTILILAGMAIGIYVIMCVFEE